MEVANNVGDHALRLLNKTKAASMVPAADCTDS
jgi:hypothetical protein